MINHVLDVVYKTNYPKPFGHFLTQSLTSTLTRSQSHIIHMRVSWSVTQLTLVMPLYICFECTYSTTTNDYIF